MSPGHETAVSELLSILRSSSRRSARALYLYLLLALAVYILTLLPILLHFQRVATIFPWPQALILEIVLPLAFLFQLISNFFRMRSDYLADIAHEARYTALLCDGLGYQISPSALAALRLRTPKYPVSIDPAQYYQSATHTGPQRLAQIVQESAFFTGSLALTTATFLWSTTIIAALTSILGFTFIVQHIRPLQVHTVAELLLTTLMFWLAGDLAHLAFRYQRLASECNTVAIHCEHADVSDFASSYHSLLLYLSATSHMPPISPMIYHFRTKRLNYVRRDLN